MMRDNYVGIGAAVWFFGALLLFSVANAAKPPEKVDHIDCSIFDAMPILQEVRPFLDELETPQQIDFKTRLAYVDDWGRRRAAAADKLDHLIEVCRKKLDEQAGD